jgi:5'-nucleotidase
MGGVARRASLIETIRKEDPNGYYLTPVIFFWTPYFNYYGGELEFKLMSMMHDASTIGNHDFDNGVEGLYKCLMPNLNSYRPIMTLKNTWTAR